MRDKKVIEITMISVFAALIVVIAAVPMLGFIQIGIISLTIIHIPVLIGGIFGGRKVSIALGLVFGLSSLIVALTRPVSPIDILFQNPLISVLPRVLFGWALYEIYVAFQKLVKNQFAAISISMVLATFTHTILVLVPLYLIGGGAEIFGDALVPFIFGVIGANGVWEMLAALLIGAPIAHRLLVWKQYQK
jgi:uncharacterized membrane protein